MTEEAGRALPPSGGDPFKGRPPVPLACITSMALVLVSGIYLVAYLPRTAPLGPAIGLVVAAGIALLVAVSMVARLRDFTWGAFSLVVKWSLAAYAVIGGLLEYIFVYDGTRGAMLVLLTVSLIFYAVDIPLLFGFSVARFQARHATR